MKAFEKFRTLKQLSAKIGYRIVVVAEQIYFVFDEPLQDSQDAVASGSLEIGIKS